MKKTRTRAFPVLLLTLAFFAGIIYFVFNLYVNASEWVSKPINDHLNNKSVELSGTITDRNGVVLAYSEDGERKYNEDYNTRCACLPVIGDSSVNNATAIQTVYRSDLSGYNLIFGFGLPDRFKSSKTITLTIDSKVQKAAYEALGGYRGAAVLYNYKTGETLCLASTPTYDPMNKPEDIETNDAYEGVYLNRSLSAAYPPGSTFKLVTAAAALEYKDDIDSFEYDCYGSDEIGGKPVTCYEVNGHVDLKEALKTSCNIFFAKLAVDIGKKQMTDKAEQMGFNKSWELDGIQTAESSYDVSKANENDLGWSGVGQYKVLETPINMAIRSAAIASEGIPVKPFFVKNISGEFGMPAPDRTTSKAKPMMSKEIASRLSDMMRYCVEANYGDWSFGTDLKICAKTGTAEVSDYGGDAHAWVTGFSLDEDCPFAFAVIVEHGDSGYRAAVPVAASILQQAVKSVRG